MQEILVYTKNNTSLTSLVQWDTDVYIYVKHAEIQQAHNVHFFNQKSDRALVVESTFASGRLSAKIPNILLQEPLPVCGYIEVEADDGIKSLYGFRITVKAKPRPSDRIYDDDPDYIDAKTIIDECRTLAEQVAEDAETADAAAQSAAQSAQSAAASAASVGQQAEAAAQSAQAAAQSAATASQQASSATQSKTAAANSATAAAQSAQSASADAQTATSKAAEATTGATTATQKASEASASAATATQKASEASASAQNAAASETNAANSAQSAAQSAASVGQSATLAESYAKGGTGTRTGEDTDNARYYKEQAELAATGMVYVEDPSTRDLNDFTEVGKYYFDRLPSHVPPADYAYAFYGSGGWLEVFNDDKNNPQNVKQIWHYAHVQLPSSLEAATAAEFVRLYATSVGSPAWTGRWGDWKPVLIYHDNMVLPGSVYPTGLVGSRRGFIVDSYIGTVEHCELGGFYATFDSSYNVTVTLRAQQIDGSTVQPSGQYTGIDIVYPASGSPRINLLCQTYVSGNLYASNLFTNVGNSGLYSYYADPDDHKIQFPLIYNTNGTIWIGREGSSVPGHSGETVISAGMGGRLYNKPSAFIFIPNANDTGGTKHAILHTGYPFFATKEFEIDNKTFPAGQTGVFWVPVTAPSGYPYLVGAMDVIIGDGSSVSAGGDGGKKFVVLQGFETYVDTDNTMYIKVYVRNTNTTTQPAKIKITVKCLFLSDGAMLSEL